MAETEERIRPGGSDALTQALEEHQSTYAQSLAGHPASGEGESEPPPVETPADTGTTEETPPVAPAPPAATRTLRYTTHEEAERAADEARNRMHEAAQEAAEWRRRTLELEDRLKQPATPPPAPTPAAPAQPAFNPKEHIRNAYKRTRTLDPTTEEFETQQEEILVEAFGEAFERVMQQQPTLTPEEIERRAIVAAETVVQRQETVRQQSEQDRLTAKLLKYATEHGLDITPPSATNQRGSEHYQDLMYAVERNRYPTDASEDQAIAAVTNVVRKWWGMDEPATPPANGTPPAATTTSPSRPSAQEAPLVPMERSGVGRTSAPTDDFDTRTMNLGELIERSMNTTRRP